jgi:hypothetical protein
MNQGPARAGGIPAGSFHGGIDMNTLIKSIITIVLAAFLLADVSHAGDKRFDFRFDARVGGQYDSNVALIDLDSSSGEPDLSTRVEAGIGVKAKLTNDTSISFAYDYSGTDYATYSEYDLDLHHGRVTLNSRFQAFDAGLSVDRYDGALDGEDYLSLTQVSPSIARLFGTRWYLRGAWLRTQKTYATLASRDADMTAFRGDVYFLLDGMRRYLAFGTQLGDENAFDAAYDFDSTQATLTYGRELGFSATDVRLKVQLRYEERDYTAAVPNEGESRLDRRLRMKIGTTFPFSEHVSLETWLEHTHNESNTAEANLDRTIAAMELAVSF